MSAVSNNLLIAGDDGYTIDRSVRLRSIASAYLNRTPSTTGTGETKIWTMSFWFKRGQLGVQQDLYSPFYGGDGAQESQMYFNSSDQFVIYDSGAAANYMYYITTQVFRDPSAWYHFVIACDTTQATASNRLKIYVNGVQITSFGTSQTQNQNTNTGYNGTSLQRIGCYARSISSLTDGYFAEFNNIDGQALTPDSFGEYDSIIGVWKPAKYTGTYGTNGFYLDFSDNTTTTTLAEDKSGNGNDWTPNNISLTSGATYDSMTDTPTIYAGGGNYAVLNPLENVNATYVGFQNANLRANMGTGVGTMCWGNVVLPTDKWYWEVTVTTVSNGTGLGISYGSNTTADGNAKGISYQFIGGKRVLTVDSSYGATYTSGDVIGVAVDKAASTVTFFKNNVSQGAISDATIATQDYRAMIHNNTSSGGGLYDINFGQRPFAYTPPAGFKELHTGNLPEPEIVDGSQYFNTVLYTGDAVQDRAVTGFDFDLGFGWIKDRGNAGSHVLVNSVSGGDKQLFSNLTNAEQTNIDITNGFTTGGLILGDNVSGTGSTNQSGYTYTLWGWKANGAGVSNTAGSITSTVSANTTAGFSIVTYTGTGSAATVGHGLGVAPKMVIVKRRDAVNSWVVWQTSITGGQYLLLDSTAAVGSDTGIWNNTTPTSTVFSVGTASNISNASGGTYVAYCFSEVEGYSKFGSYTGNGSADGPFVFTNFRPAFIILKRTDSTGNWTMYDSARSTYNASTRVLYPNLSNAEDASTDHFDWLSNGFKMKSTNQNTSGGTFIFMAFAEHPFKHSLAQ